MPRRGLVAGYVVFSGASGRVWASRDVWGYGFGVGARSAEALAVHCYALRCAAAQLGSPLLGARGVGAGASGGVHVAFAGGDGDGDVVVAVFTDAGCEGTGWIGRALASGLAGAVAAKYAGVMAGSAGSARQVRLKKLDAVAEECVRRVGPAVCAAASASLRRALGAGAGRALPGFYATMGPPVQMEGEAVTVAAPRREPDASVGCFACFGAGAAVAPGDVVEDASSTPNWRPRVHEWFDLAPPAAVATTAVVASGGPAAGGGGSCSYSRRGSAAQGGVQISCTFAPPAPQVGIRRKEVGPAPDYSADACAFAAIPLSDESRMVPLPTNSDVAPTSTERGDGRRVLVLRTPAGLVLSLPVGAGAREGVLSPDEVPLAQAWAADGAQGHALLAAWLATLDARVKPRNPPV